MRHIASIAILIPLAVVMFFVLSQLVLAQSDYRNFSIYNSKHFSILFPPSWHIWNSTGTYSQPGTTQITLGKELSENQVVDINNFLTKIEVTVIPSTNTGINSEDILSSWIDKAYSPQNQRTYGLYTLGNNPVELSGFPAHKITYNIDYNCGGSNISTHNVLIYAYSPNSENTYAISFIEPTSKSQFDYAEVQSIIKSFEIKHFLDLEGLQAKFDSGTASQTDIANLLGAQSQANLGRQSFLAELGARYQAGNITQDELVALAAKGEQLEPTENYNTSLIDYNEPYRISNTPIPAIGQYLALPYTSPPQHC